MTFEPGHKVNAHKDRPRKLRRLLKALRLGSTRTAAADYARIGSRTFYDWLQEPRIAQMVARAEAHAEVAMTQVITNAAIGYDVEERTVRETEKGTFETVKTWREHKPELALEWLDRRRKAQWAKATIQAILRAMPDEELKRQLGDAACDDYQLPAQEILTIPPVPDLPANDTP